jgi:fluoride exporter
VIFLAVVLAGAAGAAARYVVDFWIVSKQLRAVPLGTFAVNVSGSFLLGFVAGLVAFHGLPEAPAVVVGTGFLGAYTTFSTWMYEAVRLVENGYRAAAALSILGGLLAGVVAAAMGLGVAAML